MIPASATLVLAVGILYTLNRLDVYFRRRRQGRQDGIVEISRPAHSQIE